MVLRVMVSRGQVNFSFSLEPLVTRTLESLNPVITKEMRKELNENKIRPLTQIPEGKSSHGSPLSARL
jgi:hypothetical protein